MVSKVVYNVIQYSFFLKKKNKRKRHKKIVVRHSGSTIASKAKMKVFFLKKIASFHIRSKQILKNR